jgi:hypothetical protein
MEHGGNREMSLDQLTRHLLHKIVDGGLLGHPATGETSQPRTLCGNDFSKAPVLFKHSVHA